MPRKKINNDCQINYENTQEMINKLVVDAENKKYIIINYNWLFDYHKILNMISKEFTFRYNPSPETKNFIEISAFNDVIVVAKIPIIYTNITEEILVKIKYIVPYSKYNDNLFVFIFDENTISYRYSYSTKMKILSMDNDKYFSLYSFSKKSEDEFEESDVVSDEEEDDYTVDLSEDESCVIRQSPTNDTINVSFLAEEEINVSQESCYRNIENTLIKNVVCYTAIDFDHLKDIFNKFGNTRLQITVKGNQMTMRTVNPTFNKKTTITLAVLNVNPNYFNKEISFFINTKSIIKFKSLSANFSISPNEDKKIFKTVEFKIICQEHEDNNIYGITLFPGNFKSIKDSKIDNFDLYNSLMIFIPQND
ncbi:hypothetical protein Yalta_089 [Yalta virus]|nr:hypothetical protein Yalta_089 [Yalta virus]